MPFLRRLWYGVMDALLDESANARELLLLFADALEDAGDYRAEWVHKRAVAVEEYRWISSAQTRANTRDYLASVLGVGGAELK